MKGNSVKVNIVIFYLMWIFFICVFVCVIKGVGYVVEMGRFIVVIGVHHYKIQREYFFMEFVYKLFFSCGCKLTYFSDDSQRFCFQHFFMYVYDLN